MTATIVYEGDLRTRMTHVKSGEVVITDAPTDNHGKGAAFSPTDLVATALASCMLTTMGIKANQLNINMNGAEAEVLKVMASDPRRIAEVQVKITMPNESYTEKDRAILENTARTCPVAESLHKDVKQLVMFAWK
ncbi:MAG TPA: OsmC family protein [Saprospiraceae bacterium]|nr:OsmC family protein [Saprospiraceae bacterium]HMP14813.1 OsmC family protein [Saprospiraceae bacterium]